MKIGILVTNTDISAFAQSHPRDGEKFTTLLKSVRPDWQFAVFDCTAGQFPAHLDDCDGYVIGGSPASVNDTAEWIQTLFTLIRELSTMRRPVVGCCFGHQAIAKALGGEVGKNPGGWGFGVAHTRFEIGQDWMQPAVKDMKLYAAHSEQVTQLPAGATKIGGSEFCPIGSFVVGRHIMTTEYHPEMTDGFFVGLTHAFEKYIGHDVAVKAREQAKDGAQGKLFAEWMARFFESRLL